MHTTWKFSPRQEILRLLYTSHNIANGFYCQNRFLILPKMSSAPDQSVIFPDLPYLQIKRFWDQSARIIIKSDHAIEVCAPPALIRNLTDLAMPATNPSDFRSLMTQWSKIEGKFVSCLYQIIPSKKDWIKQIEIFPTRFGTSCTFNVPSKPGKFQIWLRSDQSTGTIAEALVTALTRRDVYQNLGGQWTESEIIVDWILNHSALSNLISRHPKTIKSTRALQNASLTEKSEQFLLRIGAPSVTQEQVRNIDTTQFTPREKQLFQLLLDRSPGLVTIDEISDLIFKYNPENFSLYAISKSIQRLRDRMESSGISGSFIQTRRGDGYLLNS